MYPEEQLPAMQANQYRVGTERPASAVFAQDGRTWAIIRQILTRAPVLLRFLWCMCRLLNQYLAHL